MQLRMEKSEWDGSLSGYIRTSIRAELAKGPDAPIKGGGSSEYLEALHLGLKPDNIIQFTL